MKVESPFLLPAVPTAPSADRARPPEAAVAAAVAGAVAEAVAVAEAAAVAVAAAVAGAGAHSS